MLDQITPSQSAQYVGRRSGQVLLKPRIHGCEIRSKGFGANRRRCASFPPDPAARPRRPLQC